MSSLKTQILVTYPPLPQGPGIIVAKTLAERNYYHKALWLTVAPAQFKFVEKLGNEASESVLTAGQVRSSGCRFFWQDELLSRRCVLVEVVSSGKCGIIRQSLHQAAHGEGDSRSLLQL